MFTGTGRTIDLLCLVSRRNFRTCKDHKVKLNKNIIPATVIVEILEIRVLIVSAITIPHFAVPLCIHVFPDGLQALKGPASVVAVEADKIPLHLHYAE
jgi:hypothetical protein